VELPLFIRKRVAPGALFAPAFLALVLLSGCNSDGYPEDLEYPFRTDPLMTKVPSLDAAGFDKPGEYPSLLEDTRYLIYSPSNTNADGILFPGTDPREGTPGFRDPRVGKHGLSEGRERRIADDLDKYFGSPREPSVANPFPKGSPARKQFEQLKLYDKTLARGSQLYRLHCLHCHGVPGDGRGPTASWINPHPRDFRQGIFKFTSISQEVEVGGKKKGLPTGDRKARREDLIRTMRQGVEGTAMPSFGLFPDEDLEALASYVIHLGIRGECEFLAIQQALTVKEKPAPVRVWLDQVATKWINSNAPANVLTPTSQPAKEGNARRESIRRGYEAFRAPGDASCVSCHSDFGRQSPYKFDSWGTVVRPLDLTKGVYRGGRRPLDLYWRIHSGINGSQMPPMSVKEGNDQPIWDLVNFVHALPYPAMLKDVMVEDKATKKEISLKDLIYPEVKHERE
jgi:mono/diheme cytochrome c family protein